MADNKRMKQAFDDPFRDSSLEQFDARITAALESAPVLRMPDGFTARLIESLPQKRVPLQVAETYYGRNVSLFCVALVIAVLLASATVAQHGAAHGWQAWMLVQWVFGAQLAAICLWLSLRQRQS